ncbi:ETX/MTX2 family pore-forming toxin [Macellibacteroides fermentans]|uniref:Uncharacterized protein n=1 Tax=bioreactor metagenome TaxID=1076179 RepID=A0A644U3N9_9ZZZZ
MKKVIDLLLLLLLFTSCSQEDIESLNKEYLQPPILTKSSQQTDILDQLIGIPLNFRIVNGSGPKYFGVVRPGGRSQHVELTDNPNNDIVWQILKSGSNLSGTTYNIQSMKNLNYICVLRTGYPIPDPIVEYYPYVTPYSSGATAFNIKLIDENSANYSISFISQLLPNDQYLCSKNLTDATIYFKDLTIAEGRERWEITPSDTFRLKSISYLMAEEDLIRSLPSYFDEILIVNQTGVQQSMTASFSKRATESSSFSKTKGLTLTTNGSYSVSIPKIMDINGGVSNTTTETWQFGESESRDDTRSYSFPVVVLPYKTYRARAVVSLFSASVTYVATFVGIRTNKEIKLEGKWNGVSAGSISFEIYDISNNLLKSFNSIPATPIILN